jgi:hypothetical protein
MIPQVDTLMPVDAGSGLVTLDDVRTQRILRVFGGANGSWTDLDGTTYTLTSADNDAITAVTVGGSAVQSCDGGAMPCADIDATDRLVNAQGTALTGVSFASASGSSSLAVSGATAVGQVIYRY